MNVTFYKLVPPSDLAADAIAETHLFFIEITDIQTHAADLLGVIKDTGWISKLNPVAKKSYEKVANKTIQKLITIFKSIECKVTKDFGEFLISMSSGECLKNHCEHKVLPLSELWKEKEANNHGFDFHTIGPSNKFSFGEAKYVSTGNSYSSSAEQVNRFLQEEKDGIDAVHLMHFENNEAVQNLLNGKRGAIVAFSVNSNDGEKILLKSLNNKDVSALTKKCDELYIIGVKA